MTDIRQELHDAFQVMEDTFNAADLDGVGSLSIEHWATYLMHQGFREVDAMQSLFTEFDVDNSGDLNFKEYLQLVYYWQEISSYDDLFPSDSAGVVQSACKRLRAGFMKFDPDETRTLDTKAMRSFCTSALGGIPDEFDELWDAVVHPSKPDLVSVSRFMMFLYMYAYPEGTYRIIKVPVGGVPLAKPTPGKAKSKGKHKHKHKHKHKRRGSKAPIPLNLGDEPDLADTSLTVDSDAEAGASSSELRAEPQEIQMVQGENEFCVPAHRHPLPILQPQGVTGTWSCAICATTGTTPTHCCTKCSYVLCTDCFSKSKDGLFESAPALESDASTSDGANPITNSELWQMLTAMYRVLERDFSLYDTDGDNVIDESELLLGVHNTRNVVNIVGRLQRIFQKVDTDANGTLDFTEWLHFVYSLVRRSSYAQVVARTANATVVVEGMRWLRSAYEQTDADNNKRLDRDEVIEFLNTYFGGVPSHFADLFERLQDPSRHVLDFVDFLHLLYELVLPQGKYAGLPRRSRRRKREKIPLVEKPPVDEQASVVVFPRLTDITIDEIELGRTLGEGSFGKVFLAKLRGLDVAAKFLTEQYTEDVLVDFRKETELMSEMDHPNLVFLIGTADEPPKLCIVTEYCAHGSLFDVLQKQRIRFAPSLTLSIATDIARGMAALHAMSPPVLHRDLKSLNVLLDDRWSAKICDFGLSRFYLQSIQSNKSPIGTPQWMAPEVMQSPAYGLKADVYSFGIVLWELTHYAVPFAHLQNHFQVMLGVSKGERPHISRSTPKVLAALMRACWDGSPDARPAFADILQLLESVTVDDLS
ncbi:TKL protein kinase [Thecamonas trahens ATCC 50062]|uniref:TKL protein kinase n=1 Tax=Thecamonas trahens ATCC 50062 TaxID=461836 RepID=A0A0L0DP90_THETB|nr:TKL protein kinase [Thecamonas trahens ATCC 50062]KNC54114.1 TKL protein kinase [Thecamonas trahens ATCC 50062]|eukprot:XP_013753937.1 TKL protein kinase [Thecamonas trahens ATCC 50062]